jgi:hypothetical protein
MKIEKNVFILSIDVRMFRERERQREDESERKICSLK